MKPRQARLREGWYWTGDLAYRDEAGFFYFAGRDHDWLRVDGENFASAPIERILQRHPDVVLAAVYAVPDPVVGDQVMAALQLRPGCRPLDAADVAAFLAAQGDLGTKWAPRFVRVSAALPATATNKVLKRSLRAERWNCAEPVLWQPEKGGPVPTAEPRRRRHARARRGRSPSLTLARRGDPRRCRGTPWPGVGTLVAAARASPSSAWDEGSPRSEPRHRPAPQHPPKESAVCLGQP